jgi:hypothetical protein
MESFSFEVRRELQRATSIHGPMHSLHEGLSVLQEEMFEVQMEVYKKRPDLVALRKELIQVAAMAERMAADCIEPIMRTVEAQPLHMMDGHNA